MNDRAADQGDDQYDDGSDEAADVAVSAYRRDGAWVVEELDLDDTEDVAALVDALGDLLDDADDEVVGLVSVEEEFLVIVRVGDDEPRLMLSDPSAADDWDLAASVVDLLDLDEDEEDGDEPVGDLDLLEDLGVGEAVLAELLDDPDAYPDEVLSDVARLLGFGEAFDEVAGLASA